MKKSELRQIIREQIKRVLKEENEIFKAQEACKSVIFRIKPLLEKALKLANEKGYLDSYKIRPEPFNNGYMLKYEVKINFRNSEVLYKKDRKLFNILDSNTSIYLQPNSFFQDYLETGSGNSQLEGNVFSTGGKYEAVRYPIKNKLDIKPAIEMFFKRNEQSLKILLSFLEMN